MFYINCFPPIMEAYKSNFPEGNNELVYYNFLLQNMPAIDPEGLDFYFHRITKIEQIFNNGNSCNNCNYVITYTFDDRCKICEKVTSLKDLFERLNSNQNKWISYSIKAEYLRDEGFRAFITNNYPDIAKQLDDEPEIEDKSECYRFFLQYFTRDHNDESRITGIITNKQAEFMIGNHLEENIHHEDMLMYLDEQSKPDNSNSIVFYGNPTWEYDPYTGKLSRLAVSMDHGELSYKQRLFLKDIVNAYLEAYNEIGKRDKKVLYTYYFNCIEDIMYELNHYTPVNRAEKPDEIVLGATCVESIDKNSEDIVQKTDSTDERC